MNWFDVNNECGALTVFMDFQDSEEARRAVGEEFTEKEYVYFSMKELDRANLGKMVIRGITEEMDQGHLYMTGRDQRFVFLFYIDSMALTEEWASDMDAFAEEMGDQLNPAQANRLSFLYFIAYDKMAEREIQAGNSAEVMKKFLRMRVNGGQKACFCLYRGAMERWKPQLRGMVTLAHIMSRIPQSGFNGMGLLNDTFNGVAYEEFDENEAERLDKIMKGYRLKLEDHIDESLSGLRSRCVEAIEPLLDECKAQLARLELQKGLFPKSKREYHGFLFKRFYGQENDDIVRARKHVLAEMIEEAFEDEDMETRINAWKENLSFPDMEKAVKSAPRFCQSLMEKMENTSKTAGNPALAEAAGKIAEKLVRILGESFLESLDTEKPEMKSKMEECRIRRDEAGRYESLKDCLEKLKGGLEYRFPRVLLPVSERYWLMVSEDTRTDWEENNYKAVGLEEEQVFVASVEPWQVKFLRVGKYAQADDKNQEVLDTVFGVRKEGERKNDAEGTD